MTANQFISQKLGSFGVAISEADLLEVAIASGLSGDEELTADNTDAIYIGLVNFIPQILARPTSISEGGVSLSWNRDGLIAYYKLLCRKYGLEDTVSDDARVMFY